MGLKLKVEERFTVAPKEIGKYHAFPTLTRVGEEMWQAYRSGRVHEGQVHGSDGVVRMAKARICAPSCWGEGTTLFSEGNEIDAIVSGPFHDRIFLATRTYDRKRGGDAFLSCWDVAALSNLDVAELSEREHIKDITGVPLICFGHIQETSSGTLVMPGYGKKNPGTRLHSPILLGSTDKGRTWSLKSELASSDEKGMRLNEFSLANFGSSKWVALIRNETPPYPLMLTFSEDDCHTWSDIIPTDLLGHAPMIIGSKFGFLLVLYRDLSEYFPGIAIASSADGGKGWTRLSRLASYSGSIYDGGYGDLICLGDNRFLAVYYLCDEDCSPWIEGTIFSVYGDSVR